MADVRNPLNNTKGSTSTSNSSLYPPLPKTPTTAHPLSSTTTSSSAPPTDVSQARANLRPTQTVVPKRVAFIGTMDTQPIEITNTLDKYLETHSFLKELDSVHRSAANGAKQKLDVETSVYIASHEDKLIKQVSTDKAKLQAITDLTSETKITSQKGTLRITPTAPRSQPMQNTFDANNFDVIVYVVDSSKNDSNNQESAFDNIQLANAPVISADERRKPPLVLFVDIARDNPTPTIVNRILWNVDKKFIAAGYQPPASLIEFDKRMLTCPANAGESNKVVHLTLAAHIRDAQPIKRPSIDHDLAAKIEAFIIIYKALRNSETNFTAYIWQTNFGKDLDKKIKKEHFSPVNALSEINKRLAGKNDSSRTAAAWYLAQKYFENPHNTNQLLVNEIYKYSAKHSGWFFKKFNAVEQVDSTLQDQLSVVSSVNGGDLIHVSSVSTSSSSSSAATFQSLAHRGAPSTTATTNSDTKSSPKSTSRMEMSHVDRTYCDPNRKTTPDWFVRTKSVLFALNSYGEGPSYRVKPVDQIDLNGKTRSAQICRDLGVPPTPPTAPTRKMY